MATSLIITVPNMPFFLLLPALLLCYLVGLCLYRLYFHPLAKYPGPFLAKLTNLYGLYHGYRKDIHLDVWRCHEKYGTFVRYAPDRILVNSNTAIKDIYGHGKNVKKSKAYEPLVPLPGAFNTNTAIEKSVFTRKRRLVGQGFSETALRSAEPFIREHLRSFCTSLVEVKADGQKSVNDWSEPKNISTLSTYFTYDVITELGFGKSIQTLKKAAERWIITVVESSVSRDVMAMQYPSIFKLRLGKWLSVDTWLFPTFLSDRGRLVNGSVGLVQERIAGKESMDRKDIMSYLLAAKDPETGESLSIDEVRTEAFLMLGAGGDTTSTAISATMFYLSRSPAALATVTQELRNVFPNLDSIRLGPALNSCTYLRSCLDEAMRLSPPVPGVFWREVCPGGANIDGHHIPAGYDVGTGIYSIHHNLAYFPSPFDFIPERWLLSFPSPYAKPLPFPVTEASISLGRSAFIPFSIGPRICVARSLAYLEMTLAIATVLWAAEMKVADGEEGRLGEGGWGKAQEVLRERKGEFQVWDRITSGKDGPLLCFRLRDESSANWNEMQKI